MLASEHGREVRYVVLGHAGASPRLEIHLGASKPLRLIREVLMLSTCYYASWNLITN